MEAGWSNLAAAHLQRQDAGYFRLKFASAGLPARLVAGWANLRSKLFGVPYGDQGLLISRALYDEVECSTIGRHYPTGWIMLRTYLILAWRTRAP